MTDLAIEAQDRHARLVAGLTVQNLLVDACADSDVTSIGMTGYEVLNALGTITLHMHDVRGAELAALRLQIPKQAEQVDEECGRVHHVWEGRIDDFLVRVVALSRALTTHDYDERTVDHEAHAGGTSRADRAVGTAGTPEERDRGVGADGGHVAGDATGGDPGGRPDQAGDGRGDQGEVPDRGASDAGEVGP